MKRSKEIMKSETSKINLYDETLLPKISHLVNTLGEREKQVIIALVEKSPDEKWEDVAKRVGITTRQLWNIRQNEKVQEAACIISKDLLKSDVPDVLKMLSRKAKCGEPWAVKLFLEVSGELNDGSQFANVNVISNSSWSEDMARAAQEAAERLQKMSTEDLMQDLEKRLKQSSKGIAHTDSSC